MICADCCVSIPTAHDNSGGFEGPEKHLELDFRSTDRSASDNGFLSTADVEWAPVLEAARVRVLSIVSTPSIRMLLLSESSMFIYSNKIILKTCGTTRLLCAIEPILAIASRLGLEATFCAFHRRNYIFPDAQVAPHCTFPMEVRYLQDFFPTGRGHIVGPIDGPHSHFFAADLTTPEAVASSRGSPPSSPALHEAPSATCVSASPREASPFPPQFGSACVGSPTSSSGWSDPRQPMVTFEIMMTQLPAHVMRPFYREDPAFKKDVELTAEESSVAEEEKARASLDITPEAMLAVSLKESPDFVILSPKVVAGCSDWALASADRSRWPDVARSDEEVSLDDTAKVGAMSIPPPEEVLINQRPGAVVVSDATVDAAYCANLSANAPCPVFFQEPRHVILESRMRGAEVTRESKIDTLLPGSVIDAYMFEPCGYSMNGVADGRHYWTMHITPEPHCSFVSFETCLPMRQYASVVRRVMRVFQPGHAMVRVLANENTGPRTVPELVAGLDATTYAVDHCTEITVAGNARLLLANLTRISTETIPTPTVSLETSDCLAGCIAVPDIPRCEVDWPMCESAAALSVSDPEDAAGTDAGVLSDVPATDTVMSDAPITEPGIDDLADAACSQAQSDGAWERPEAFRNVSQVELSLCASLLETNGKLKLSRKTKKKTKKDDSEDDLPVSDSPVGRNISVMALGTE